MRGGTLRADEEVGHASSDRGRCGSAARGSGRWTRPATTGRPVVSVTTAPAGFEGEGFPVRRAFAGVDRRYLDPFIHMDQMGEVEYAPGEPKGTPVAPAPGLRDGDLHDRRDLPAPGLHRRRRADHRRGHPVDDGRRRDPPHRGPAGGPGGQRRALPRHPAVGQPAPGGQDDRPPLPGHRSVQRRPAVLARRRRAVAGDRRRRGRPRRARLHPLAHGHGARHAGPGGPGGDSRGGRSSTPWSTSWVAPVRWGRTGARSAPASWPSSATGTRSPSAADDRAGLADPEPRRADPRADGPSGSRSTPTDRS